METDENNNEVRNKRRWQAPFIARPSLCVVALVPLLAAVVSACHGTSSGASNDGTLHGCGGVCSS